MSDIPTAIHTAELQIGGLTLRVHNLDNGQRVIDAEDAERFFFALASGNLQLSGSECVELAKALVL